MLMKGLVNVAASRIMQLAHVQFCFEPRRTVLRRRFSSAGESLSLLPFFVAALESLTLSSAFAERRIRTHIG